VQFTLHTLRFIHTNQDTNANRVIVCAGKNKRTPSCTKPPFCIYDLNGQFSDEYISMYNPLLDPVCLD
ncbi:MAG: hypothetical protein L3J69_07655, partial [Desulfobacula sp.]|nr:hypothetical protein [Desulfobacula sp.]